jgi:hypothetical protein
MQTAPSILRDPAAVIAYAQSGNAKLTIKSAVTGKHFTYHLKAPTKTTEAGGRTKDYNASVRFVSVLHDGDQWGHIASWFDKKPTLAAGRKGNANSNSFKALDWVLRQATQRAARGAAMPHTVEVWHEGSCGRCGRSLTDPTSIARGLGPDCATKGLPL